MQKSWLNAKDIMELVPCMSLNSARKTLKVIRAEMKKEGAYLFESKELVAPRKRILEKLEIEVK